MGYTAKEKRAYNAKHGIGKKAQQKAAKVKAMEAVAKHKPKNKPKKPKKPKVIIVGPVDKVHKRGKAVSNKALREFKMFKTPFVIDRFVRRREYLTTLMGNTSDTPTTNNAYWLNPGNATLFKLFSRIASIYKTYKLHGLDVIFDSDMFLSNATADPAGFIYCVTNFDASEDVYTTKDQYREHSDSVRMVPFESFKYSIPLHKQRKEAGALLPLKINNSYNTPLPANDSSADPADRIVYNVGLLQFTAVNSPTTKALCDVYVEFTFELIEQTLPLSVDETSTLHLKGTPLDQKVLSGVTSVNASSNLNITNVTDNTLTVTVNSVKPNHVMIVNTLITATGGNWVGNGGLTGTGEVTGYKLFNTGINSTSTFSSGSNSPSYSNIVGLQHSAVTPNLWTLSWATPALNAGTAVSDFLINYIHKDLVSMKEMSRMQQLESQLEQKYRLLNIKIDELDAKLDGELEEHLVQEAKTNTPGSSTTRR